MGSWDCYCAICAGPMSRVVIRSHDEYQPQPGSGTRVASVARVEDDGESVKSTASHGEDRSEEEDDEDIGSGYDPMVLEPADIDWTEDCRVLGFNPESIHPDKGFISSPGSYDDYGGMTCEQGDDPSAEGVDLAASSCYADFNGEEPVFPFHIDCFKLLCQCLMGSEDIGSINKAVLYNVMRPLSPSYGSLLNLDYNEPNSGLMIPAEQYWCFNPGEEFYVVSPLRMVRLSAEEIETFRSGRNLVPIDSGLGAKVKLDPFSALPPEIIAQIMIHLDHKCLINLFRASWVLHSTHHHDDGFWKQRLRAKMGWFFELHEFLQSTTDDDITSMKAVYLWAQKKTKPRLGRKGKYMGVANRRRIWGICSQLAELYRAKVPIAASMSVDKPIRNYAASSEAPMVTSSRNATGKMRVQSLWVTHWEELAAPKTIDTFWDKEGYLIGISATIDRDRRLFGFDDTTRDVEVRSVQLNRITGIILHIPPIDPLAPSIMMTYPKFPNTFSSPRGIVILTSNHGALSMGETNVGHCQRPLLPPNEEFIVGVIGQTAFIDKKPRILRLGLLLCPRSPALDGSTRPRIPKPPQEQRYLWTKSGYKLQNGKPIWEDIQLRIRTFEGGLAQQPSDYFHNDMVPKQAFIWAPTKHALKHMKALKIYSVVSGTWGSSHKTRLSKSVGNLRADFTPASGIEPVWAREKDTNGTPIPEDDVETFEIDGPGGERIIELSARMGLNLDAFKIRTNRGRQYLWRNKYKIGDGWKFITVRAGHEAIAGLVLGFGQPCGYDPISQSFKSLHTQLDHIDVLTVGEFNTPVQPEVQPKSTSRCASS